MKSVKSTLYFHLYCKWHCFWRNLHRWQKFCPCRRQWRHGQISPLHPLQMSAWKMGIANIYILEKGTMIHHFVCVGHKILNLKKIVVLQIPRVAKTNLSFVKMTFMSRFQVLVYWRVESRVTDRLLDHKNKDLSKKTAWTRLIGWVTGHVRPKALYTNAKKNGKSDLKSNQNFSYNESDIDVQDTPKSSSYKGLSFYHLTQVTWCART